KSGRSSSSIRRRSGQQRRHPGGGRTSLGDTNNDGGHQDEDLIWTMNKMMKRPIILVLATLVVCEALWPNDGLHYCDEIVHALTAANCTDCFNAAVNTPSNAAKTEECMTLYMPPTIARCAKNLDSDRKKFSNCVKNAARSQSNLDGRTRHLYSKAGAMLDVVKNAVHIPNGPQALLSAMAQNILLYSPELNSTLENVASECWDRFENDPKNAEWHLNTGKPWRAPTRRLSDIIASMSARNIQFAYGAMGHDMPFHGVGPLAVDYLLGECVVRDMIKYDRANSGSSLQTLVDTLLKYDAPVPAWVS
ncbi:unnamed protein product, partial [Meganyctiphanes norvegica]